MNNKILSLKFKKKKKIKFLKERIKFLKLKKFKKVKLSPGSTGIVIEQSNLATDDFDEHCIVLVEAKALSVPVRFLNHVD